MTSIRPFALIIFVLGSTCLADQPKLPKPPAGYQWQWCPEIKSAFLKPDGWHFKKWSHKGKDAYFITKEDIDEKGEYSTGLSVNVLTHMPRFTGMPPSEYAERFVAQMEKADLKSFSKWRCDSGPFKGLGCRYAGDVHTSNNVLIANDKTGTLFIVMFEAPTKEWDEA